MEYYLQDPAATPSPNNRGGNRKMRASTASGLTKTNKEEELKKQAESGVKDPITALKFLMDGDFKSDDKEMSFELLAAISMQLLQKPRETKMASEAFKAISYLIFEIHQNNTV